MNKPRHMRRWLLAGAAVVAFGAVATVVGTAGAAPVKQPLKQPHPVSDRKVSSAAKAVDVVPDSYLVTLKDRRTSTAAVPPMASTLARAVGATVTRSYSRLAIFAVQMTAEQAKAMAKRPEVAHVDPNFRRKLADVGWNLDRIDQPYLPLSNTAYTPPVSASDVHAYVIDSGIHGANSAFGGRVETGRNFVGTGVDGDTNTDDCEGHGTHVAGTIGGDGFGVAPGVRLVPVRVGGCTDSVDDQTLVRGIDWVTANAVKPAVANVSIGGSYSAAIDAAVQSSIDSGITYAVAAGNADPGYVSVDACGSSPADVPAAITVAAVDNTDHRADFSYFGPCVDLFAPGVDVVSAANASSGTTVMSGTSMATPHVTGAAALLLEANPSLTPQQVRDTLVSRAVSGAIDNPGLGTPNKLLQVEAAAPAVAPQVVRLRSRANQQVVDANPSGNQQLIANRVEAGAWEEFDVVDAGGGFVALRSHANGKYVSADAAGSAPLVNNRTAFGAWEEFRLITNADGSVSLQANANGLYVTADSGGAKPLIANRTAIGAWEEFDVTAATSVIGIGAFANNQVVTADAAGTKPLIANRDSLGQWETFDAVDVGNGWTAFISWANGSVVTADNGGTKPLIANRSTAGPWEQFKIVRVAPGVVGLQAGANGKYVTAENAGTLPLIANRTSIGAWEQFAIFA